MVRKRASTKDENRDPLTDEPGAHPVGVGIGTAAGGAAAGMAAGAAAGPVGAAVGAVIGGVAGGLAGKAAAEAIDPTAEDAYWRENYKSRPYVAKNATYDAYQPAYRYGWEASSQYPDRSFADVETDLEKGWQSARGRSKLSWEKAMPAVQDAFDRTIQLHEEKLHVRKQPVKKGEVRVRKEVVTENKSFDVPVEREEVVIERRPASGRRKAGDVKAEEIRIPVKEERVHLEKETVVNEEVKVGKRKVQDTEHVSGTVRREKLKVDKDGDARVRGDSTRKRG